VFRQSSFVLSVQNVHYSSILVPTKTPELEKFSDSRSPPDVPLDDPPTPQGFVSFSILKKTKVWKKRKKYEQGALWLLVVPPMRAPATGH
jgi:hypothetical protein